MKELHLNLNPQKVIASLCFEAFDLVSKQISTRFGQESTSISIELEKLLIEAASEQTVRQVNVPSLLSVYSKDTPRMSILKRPSCSYRCYLILWK